MSSIAVQRHTHRYTNVVFYQSLLGIAKGNNDKVRSVTLNYLINNPRTNLAQQIVEKMKKTAPFKGNELSPDEVRQMHELSEEIISLMNDGAMKPTETIGKVIDLVAKFRKAHEVAYIDIKGNLDEALLDLTVSQVSKHPESAMETVNVSLNAMITSSEKQNAHGVPVRLPDGKLTNSLSKLHRLKGFLELEHSDTFKKLPYGISSFFPMKVVDEFRSNMKDLFDNRKDVFSAAQKLVVISNRFKSVPTGPSGMVTRKHCPKFLSRDYLLSKLNEIYLDHGESEMIKQARASRVHFARHKLFHLPTLLQENPAILGLFENKIFGDDEIISAISHFTSDKRKNKNYYDTPYEIYFGPDFKLSDSLLRNYEDVFNSHDEPTVYPKTPREAHPDNGKVWDEKFPGIPTDAVVIDSKIFTLQDGLYAKFTPTRAKGARL